MWQELAAEAATSTKVLHILAGKADSPWHDNCWPYSPRISTLTTRC
jgi:hypothetical protein